MFVCLVFSKNISGLQVYISQQQASEELTEQKHRESAAFFSTTNLEFSQPYNRPYLTSEMYTTNMKKHFTREQLLYVIELFPWANSQAKLRPMNMLNLSIFNIHNMVLDLFEYPITCSTRSVRVSHIPKIMLYGTDNLQSRSVNIINIFTARDSHHSSHACKLKFKHRRKTHQPLRLKHGNRVLQVSVWIRAICLNTKAKNSLC